MTKARSFTKTVWDKYSGEIETAVSGYIEDSFARPDLGSRYAQEPDRAELAELNLHRVIAYDTPGEALAFDAVVIAEIEVYHTSHSEAMESGAQKWFRVSCEAALDNGLKGFRVKSIEEYDAQDTNPRKLLSDTLVPYIYAADLEKNAEAILAEVYPEALSEPTAIDVREFAGRLGLTVEERRLSRSAAIFGEMIFSGCKVEYYDPAVRRYDSFDAEGGTVIVDPEVYFLRTLGSWNNTVIHECVHWIKHRRVFELERLYNESASRIRCKVAESTTDEQKRSDTEWMEWHANALAPRILMPREQFSLKAAEAIARHKLENGTDTLGDIISGVIAELSEFFGVSVQAAKIRMIDVGYAEAIGAFEYVDDHYVSPYSFRSGAIGRNQSFSVPLADAVAEYAFSADFRRLIDSGDFVHVDNHYCINNPKYVKHDENGLPELTEYASRNIDECCIVFDRATRPNSGFGAQRYTECVLFQSAVSKTVTEFKYSHGGHNKEIEARAEEMRAELDEAKQAAGILKKLPGSFCDSLKMLMEWRGITVERIAEKSLLSPKTIQRMRKDRDHIWKIETIAAVCVGLQLPSYISATLIEKAGLTTKVGEKGITLAHLLATHYKKSIYEINEYLEIAGYPPLGGAE
jgi:hypothetical protein